MDLKLKLARAPIMYTELRIFRENSYGLQPVIIFAKSSILDVWLGSEYTSRHWNNFHLRCFRVLNEGFGVLLEKAVCLIRMPTSGQNPQKSNRINFLQNYIT